MSRGVLFESTVDGLNELADKIAAGTWSRPKGAEMPAAVVAYQLDVLVRDTVRNLIDAESGEGLFPDYQEDDLRVLSNAKSKLNAAARRLREETRAASYLLSAGLCIDIVRLCNSARDAEEESCADERLMVQAILLNEAICALGWLLSKDDQSCQDHELALFGLVSDYVMMYACILEIDIAGHFEHAPFYRFSIDWWPNTFVDSHSDRYNGASVVMGMRLSEIAAENDKHEGGREALLELIENCYEAASDFADDDMFPLAALTFDSCLALDAEAFGMLMTADQVNTYAVCLLELGRVDDAVRVLHGLLHNAAWEEFREEASAADVGSYPDLDSLIGEPCYVMACAHANASYALGLLSRSAYDLALSRSGPVAFSSRAFDPFKSLARSLREIAVAELKLAQDIMPGLAALDLQHAALLFDGYQYALPNYGSTSVDLLRRAWSACWRVSEHRANALNLRTVGRVRNQCLELGLEYLGTVALEAEMGEKRKRHKELILDIAQKLRVCWIRNGAFTYGDDGLSDADNMLLSICDYVARRHEDVMPELVARLAIVRLQVHQIKRLLKCSVEDGGGYASRCLKNDALKAYLNSGAWGEEGQKALRALERIDKLQDEGRVSGDIAYYTSVDNAQYLFDDLVFPADADFPVSIGDCVDSNESNGNRPIARNCLTLMHASYMNDPSEGSVLFRCVKPDGDGGGLLQRSHADLRDLMFGGSFIFIKSFTACMDQLHMWSLYGRSKQGVDGAGCCIRFAPETFAAGGDDSFPFEDYERQGMRVMKCMRRDDDFDLFRIAYLLDEGKGFSFGDGVRKDTAGHLSKCVQTIKDAVSGLQLAESAELQDMVESAIVQLLSDIVFLFKDGSYRREEEMRMVVMRTLNDVDHSGICPLLSGSGAVPRYCVKPFKQVYVDRIILGPKVVNSDELIPHLQYELARMRGKGLANGVDIAPVVLKSTIPYR